MTDQELAARWDADHRLAATASFVSGLVVVVGTALMFSIGTVPVEAIVQGHTASAFEVTLVTGLLLVIDIALLLFVVGLAHAFTEGRSFGLTATSAVVTLATTASATLHLTWGYVASSPEVDLPAEIVQFVTWLSVNLWLLPLFGLLVGATLLALTLALRTSSFRFARRLGTASAVVGGVLFVLAPFTGFEPNQQALGAVAAILLATVGISALLLVALVRLGMLLRKARHIQPSSLS
jgi:hypothetical protein